MIKRLYNWVLSWSESRWGWLALFILALCESSWFPIPPDILLIALCLGAIKKSFRFAAICLAGSIIGAAVGYGIGHFLWTTPTGDPTAIATFFFNHVFSVEGFNNVGALFDKYNLKGDANLYIKFVDGKCVYLKMPYGVNAQKTAMLYVTYHLYDYGTTVITAPDKADIITESK